jgi:hypothetical protein
LLIQHGEASKILSSIFESTFYALSAGIACFMMQV